MKTRATQSIASPIPLLNPTRRHSKPSVTRSEEHTSELQSQSNLVCRLLLEKKTPITANSSKSRPPPLPHKQQRRRNQPHRRRQSHQPPQYALSNLQTWENATHSMSM